MFSKLFLVPVDATTTRNNRGAHEDLYYSNANIYFFIKTFEGL